MNVIVVGSGITGLSTAWALARQGVSVTLVDQDPIPGPRAASNDQTRILNPVFSLHPGYPAIANQSSRAWSRLFEDLGRSGFQQTGTLELMDRRGARSKLRTEAYATARVSHSVLPGSALSERYGALQFARDVEGIVTDYGGVFMAYDVLRGITDFLIARDVQLRPGACVTDVDLNRGTVTLEDGDVLVGDRIIVAAGGWVQRIRGVPSFSTTSVRQTTLVLHSDDGTEKTWEAMPVIVDAGLSVPVSMAAAGGKTGARSGLYVHFQNTMSDEFDIDGSRMPNLREGVSAFERVSHLLTDPDRYRISDLKVFGVDVTDDALVVLKTGARGLVVGGCNGSMFQIGALVGCALAAWAQDHVDITQLGLWMRADYRARAFPDQFL